MPESEILKIARNKNTKKSCNPHTQTEWMD